MRRDLHRNRDHQRSRRQQQQIETAIFIVGLKQPIETKQCRQQGHHPDDTGGDAGQDARLRADAEGKQHDRQHEEGEHGQRIRAISQRQPQIAAQDHSRRAHGMPSNDWP